jgi:histidine triad (HIT) family protein
MACIFCQIVSGEIPADVIHRDDRCVVFRDTRPQAPTHCLIVPVEHIPAASDVRSEHGGIIGCMIAAAAMVARQEGVAETGYRLVFNVGRDAGQSVDHLHLHLLGGRALAWPPG